jgi:hypothetical protein
MTLENYIERLKKHDWYYIMSDDLRWYESGLAEQMALLKLADEKPEFMTAYKEEFHKYFPPKNETKT